ncbi:hypothetical protein TrVGV298_012037 [Trichoderma virens]|nr:hypothetical protein TrVGV298_012037 [Trichoderma virens]
MRSSALFALLPLASALPQAVPAVEVRDTRCQNKISNCSECNHNGWGFDKRSLEAGDATSQSEGAESCQAAHDSCKTACNWWPWEARWSYCLPLCSRQLDICTGNNPEKRFIEERDDAVETYPVPVESLPTETQPAQTQPTQTQVADSCEDAHQKCRDRCSNVAFTLKFICPKLCYYEYNACTGKTTEKRSVESLPVETQPADSCKAAYKECYKQCNGYLKWWGSFCPETCDLEFNACTGNTHEKRYRGDYAQEITGCYSAVAKCKNEGHKSIEECYAPLNDCLQGLFDKYGIA